MRNKSSEKTNHEGNKSSDKEEDSEQVSSKVTSGDAQNLDFLGSIKSEFLEISPKPKTLISALTTLFVWVIPQTSLVPNQKVHKEDLGTRLHEYCCSNVMATCVVVV